MIVLYFAQIVISFVTSVTILDLFNYMELGKEYAVETPNASS